MHTDDSTTRLMKTVAATLLVAVVGLLVEPTLSDWQRRQLAERLAARLGQVDDANVKVPLRQLDELGQSAIEHIVVASTSERAAVASVARQIIDEKMTALTVATQSSSGVEFVDSTLSIGSSLSAHIHDFVLGP